MKESETNEKIKNFFGNIGKISKKLWIIIAVVVVAVIIGATYLGNRKSSVLTDDVVKVSFNGYNGSGSVNFDNNDLRLKMLKIMAKKVGLSSDLEQQLNTEVDKHSKENSTFNESSLNPEQSAKVKKMEKWFEDVDISVTPNQNLKNGQKVKLKVDPGVDKTNPIKAETKTFTVKGLKQIKKASTESVLSSIKVKYAGFNGLGRVVLKSKSINTGTFKVKKNGKLSNGDEIKIIAPNSLFNKEGVKYSGKRSITATVEGLQDLSKIKNVDEIKKISDEVVKNDHKDDFTITFINLYAFPDTSDDDSSSSSKSSVEINEDSASKVYGHRMKTIGLYQIVDNTITDSEPSLAEVIIRNLKDEDNVVNISTIKTSDDASINYISDSLTIEQHNLMADGIKLK